jgi:hypothetical protein
MRFFNVEIIVTLSKVKYRVLHNNDLWRVYIADDDKTYFDIQVNWPIFCPILTKFILSWQILIKVPNMTYRGNSFDGSRAHKHGQTDGHDEANRRFLLPRERAY